MWYCVVMGKGLIWINEISKPSLSKYQLQTCNIVCLMNFNAHSIIPSAFKFSPFTLSNTTKLYTGQN